MITNCHQYFHINYKLIFYIFIEILLKIKLNFSIFENLILQIKQLRLYNLPFYISIFLYDKLLVSVFLDITNLFKFVIKNLIK